MIDAPDSNRSRVVALGATGPFQSSMLDWKGPVAPFRSGLCGVTTSTSVPIHASRLERSSVTVETADAPSVAYPIAVDEPYVESIHFSKWSCPSGIVDGTNPAAGSNVSRAAVSFDVDSSKRTDCAMATADGITFYNTRAACGKEIIGGDLVIGLEWEPKCMYVVVAPDNQARMFDEMMVRCVPSCACAPYDRSGDAYGDDGVGCTRAGHGSHHVRPPQYHRELHGRPRTHAGCDVVGNQLPVVVHIVTELRAGQGPAR